jgi:dynein heavy chain
VDANLVPAANVAYVKQHFSSNEMFTPEIMGGKSKAAEGVCSWVLNIVKYYDVIQTIEPKRKALKEATDQLEEANEKLGIVNARVGELNA